jgi:N-acetyl-gamma-glutamyl-phosphate reductase
VDCPFEEVKSLYVNYYQEGMAFSFVSEAAIDLKQVVNTNKCLIQLEKTRQ